MSDLPSKNILFIVYPTISHYISIFPIAYAYKRKGFSIYFSGQDSYENFILSKGFNFFSLAYFETYSVSNWKQALFFFMKGINPTFPKKRYKEFLKFKQRIYYKVSKGGFCKVFIDAHLSYYYVFLPSVQEFYIINTKLSTLKSFSVPPLSSSIVFKKTTSYSLISSLLWIKRYIQNSVSAYFRKIIFHGCHEHYFLKKVLAKKGIRFKDIFLVGYKSCFYYELNLNKTHIYTLITGCKDIEYEWKKLHCYEHYINLRIHISFEDKNKWESLYLFINKYKPASSFVNVNLIYCSFGTITRRFEKKIFGFINKLVKAFGNNNKYALLISTGNTNFEFSTKYENIFISKRLPQDNILQICDLMITHGGMNSIKECLFFKVPMLVYPLNLKFDQPGNAARIQYKKLGLKGNMKKDNSKTILLKTNKILTKIV